MGCFAKQYSYDSSSVDSSPPSLPKPHPIHPLTVKMAEPMFLPPQGLKCGTSSLSLVTPRLDLLRLRPQHASFTPAPPLLTYRSSSPHPYSLLPSPGLRYVRHAQAKAHRLLQHQPSPQYLPQTGASQKANQEIVTEGEISGHLWR
jgi:hypothetical protein